jgi:phosphohistidine phosphatase SixA
VQNLALRLLGSRDNTAVQKIKAKFPTAAVAVIALPIEDWKQIQSKSELQGEIELFLTPKMLKD